MSVVLDVLPPDWSRGPSVPLSFSSDFNIHLSWSDRRCTAETDPSHPLLLITLVFHGFTVFLIFSTHPVPYLWSSCAQTLFIFWITWRRRCHLTVKTDLMQVWFSYQSLTQTLLLLSLHKVTRQCFDVVWPHRDTLVLTLQMLSSASASLATSDGSLGS